MSHFYALMYDNTIKFISIKEEIVNLVKDIFIKSGSIFKPDNIEEDEFDGNIISRNMENIMYVNFDLPESFNNIPNNQADIPEYNIVEDMKPKSIFYYDNGKFYFQVFNQKNLFERKMILHIEHGNTFSSINNTAFVIDEKVHAIYENHKLYFHNYTMANQIFSLKEFLIEATDTEIKLFGERNEISVNYSEIIKIANIKTRRLIKLLSYTNNIEIFMKKTTRTKINLLKKYVINSQISDDGKLVIPTTNTTDLNRSLEFLNEDIFSGIITKSTYRSNSKKKEN